MTSNVDVPRQVVVPSDAVPVSVMLKPVPAGSAEMTALTVLLWAMSSAPERVNPPGPVTV